MALVYVGGTSGAGTSTGYTVSLTGLTGGIASAPAAGDVVVVFSAFGNTASSAPNVTGNNSGAYLAATAAQHVNDTWDTEFRSFYEVMGATPDTSLTITRATNTAYGGATVVQVWRGVDTTTPFIGAATPASGTNGAALNPPAYDPAVTGAIIIAGGAGTMPAAGTAGYTSISGMSNAVVGYGNGSTADISVIMASYAYAGASYDPATATGGTQNNTSSSWAGVTLALRPLTDLAGDLSSELEATTSAATGSLSIAAAAALTLAVLTGGGGAALSLSGSGAATLGPATLTAASMLQNPSVSAVLSATLESASSGGASSALLIRGAGVVTLSGVTGAAVGGLLLRGTLSGGLAEATVSGLAGVRVVGALSQSLADVSASGEATNPALGINGAVNAALDAATLLGSSAHPVTAQAAAALAGADFESAARLSIRGVGAIDLAPVSGVLSGSLQVAGSVGAVLDNAGGSGASMLVLSAVSAPPLASATLQAEAVLPLTGAGAALLDPAVLWAVGEQHDPLSASAISALVDAIWARSLPQGDPPAYVPGLRTLTGDELVAVAAAVWAKDLL